GGVGVECGGVGWEGFLDHLADRLTGGGPRQVVDLPPATARVAVLQTPLVPLASFSGADEPCRHMTIPSRCLLHRGDGDHRRARWTPLISSGDEGRSRAEDRGQCGRAGPYGRLRPSRRRPPERGA